jgi:hypothetical protein
MAIDPLTYSHAGSFTQLVVADEVETHGETPEGLRYPQVSPFLL